MLVFLSCLFMTLDLENLKILQQYHLDFEAGFAVSTVFFYPSSLNDELLDPVLTFFFHIFSYYYYFFFKYTVYIIHIIFRPYQFICHIEKNEAYTIPKKTGCISSLAYSTSVNIIVSKISEISQDPYASFYGYLDNQKMILIFLLNRSNPDCIFVRWV